MKFSIPILLLLLLTLSCNKMSRDDPRISELQKDVTRLSEQNKQLSQSLSDLRRELEEVKARPPVAVAQTSTVPQKPPMTVERMKMGVEPLLEEIVRKIKASSDTPKKGDQYGMRIEFDLKHAVYGLVQSKDSKSPYAARVIVGYEKFLESQKESRSMSSGSEQFYFVYRDPKWVYQPPTQ